MGILCKEWYFGGGDIFSLIFFLKVFVDGDLENNFFFVVFVVILKLVYGLIWLYFLFFVVF